MSITFGEINPVYASDRFTSFVGQTADRHQQINLHEFNFRQTKHKVVDNNEFSEKVVLAREGRGSVGGGM